MRNKSLKVIFAFLCLRLLCLDQLCIGEDRVQTKSSGPVSVSTTLSPGEPTIGDEITLTIQVASEKDVEVLMPEFGEALQTYTILDYVPRQKIEPDGSMVQSQKYTLQPFLSGPQSIPPILIEFVDNRPGQKNTPDDFDAYEILTDRIDFDVKSVLPESASDELKPPLGELELQQDVGAAAVWTLAIGGGLIVFGALIATYFLWLRGRTKSRRENAYVIAINKLNRLLDDQQGAAPKYSVEQFYIEISGIIRRYLENRYDVRAPDLTTDEFLQLAADESELSREHQTLLGEFLKQADIVKFAGVQASEDGVKRSTDLARKFLEETRENAPDVEVEADESSSGKGIVLQAPLSNANTNHPPSKEVG